MYWNFKIFGNGHGMAVPFFDQKFYWLSGRFYTWIGGYGAQLTSFEWKSPLPGTERKIAGRKFRVFSSVRGHIRFLGFNLIPLKWSVSWRMEGMGGDIDNDRAKIETLRKDLDNNLSLMGGSHRDR